MDSLTNASMEPTLAPPEQSPLARAVDAVGGQAELARRIGGPVRQAHVWNWLNRQNGLPPAEHCRAIEAATGGQVTRYDLRPDVYGDPPPPDIAKALG